MDFDRLARSRYSLRSYDPDRIPSKDLILEILETAAQAPSAHNKEPWFVRVVQSPSGLDALHAAYSQRWFLDVPTVVAVSGRREAAWVRPFDSYNSLETDLAIFADHLLLAARDRGLGSCPIANFEPEVLRGALGLDGEEEIFLLCALGYPAGAFSEEQKPARKGINLKIRWA